MAAAGVQLVRVKDSREYIMIYIQGAPDKGQITHQSIVTALSKLKYIEKEHYLLGTITGLSPHSTLKKITQQEVGQRVKGAQMSNEALMTIAVNDLTHAQVKRKLVLLSEKLKDDTKRCRSDAHSAESRLGN